MVRVAMPVVSQCSLKRCQALWRGAALGSHLAAWVWPWSARIPPQFIFHTLIFFSYCTLCVTRRRMARSMSLGLADTGAR